MGKRGFASLTPEKRSEIARMGGKAAHAAGTAHRYTHEEAVENGRKGGLQRIANQRKPKPLIETVSDDANG